MMNFSWKDTLYTVNVLRHPDGSKPDCVQRWYYVLAEIKYRGRRWNYYIKGIPEAISDQYVRIVKLDNPIQGVKSKRDEAEAFIEGYFERYK